MEILYEKEYLEQRVEKMIQRYNEISKTNRTYYQVVMISGLISLLTLLLVFGYGDKFVFDKGTVISSLAIISLISMLAEIIGKFNENWINYGTRAKAMSQEKYLYFTYVPPYDNSERFKIFVQKIESLLFSEKTDLNYPGASNIKISEPDYTSWEEIIKEVKEELNKDESVKKILKMNQKEDKA